MSSLLWPLVAAQLFVGLGPEKPASAEAPAHAPCEAAPEGMVCIPGGPAVVGSDDGPRFERPRRTVEISTFYLDAHEVTIEDYNACVAARACKPLKNQQQRIMRPFVEAKRPAVPVDWFRAHAYCAWAGKRLPTEWEWEKAARGEAGELYPWGNDAPTCDKAIFRECAPKGCEPYPGKRNAWDCVEHATKDVGSFPAGRYGVFDLAGNGYEWTSTWASPVKACGARCRGRDPLGPCDGAYPCPKHKQKILKGGSWYWPKSHLKGSWRRPEKLATGGHRLSFRCASSTPELTRFPPRLLEEERPAPPPPAPPTEEQLAAFTKVREDPVEKKVPCAESGRAFTDCRDPTSYVRSNEPRQHLFAPYVKNLGGGYVGVGIDQNYSLVALARSEWVWLFDYDPTITRLHYVLRAMILRSESVDAFLARFAPENKKASLALLEEEYRGHKERRAFKEVFRVYRGALYKHYQKERLPDDEEGEYGWLRHEEQYRYIRTLYQQGRIALRKGDMLARRCLHDIGDAAKALGVTVRVYYPSNAPELWPWSRQYKRNVLNLPFDEKSVVVQTTSGLDRRMGQKGYWHYNVEGGLHQQALLRRKGYTSLRQVLFDHVPADDPDLSVLGLPSR